MKTISIFLVVFMLVTSCSDTHQKNDPVSIKENDTISLQLKTTEPPVEEEKDEKNEEDDCIFNNDYYMLTKKWLNHSGISSFTWDNEKKHAIVFRGKDTMYLSEGGCYHYNHTFKIVLTGNKRELSDSAYWINESMNYIKQFGFNFYEEGIHAKTFKVNSVDEQQLWFDFDYDNEGNRIYNGIIISEEEKNKVISISYYSN